MLSNLACSVLSAPSSSGCSQEPVQEPHQAPLGALPSPTHGVREPGGDQDEVVSVTLPVTKDRNPYCTLNIREAVGGCWKRLWGAAFPSYTRQQLELLLLCSRNCVLDPFPLL